MAALGTLLVYDPPETLPDPVVLIGDYNIERGRFLGVLPAIDIQPVQPARHSVLNYIVRQTRILFRQLWPSHGQRFPQ